MSDSNPQVVVMPLNFNGKSLLEKCLPALKRACQKAEIEVNTWVIDNNSSDGSKEFVNREFPEFKFIQYSENKILTSYNDAFKQCKAPYILILNNDMVVDEDFIEPLYKRITSEKDCFAVSPKIDADLASDSFLIRLSGEFKYGFLKPVPQNDGPGGTLYFHGGAALIDRTKFLELGGFDSLFFYFEDNDLSYRAWQNRWTCLFEPQSKVFHLGSQTTQELYGQDFKRGLKEKASNLFILKNLKDPDWLKQFKWRTFLKFMNMIFKVDSIRLFALIETIKKSRKLKPNDNRSYTDQELMQKISNLKLEEIQS